MSERIACFVGALTLILVATACRADDPRFRESRQAESAGGACAAYGQGFFQIKGTSTCVKVGGGVTVEYKVRR